MYFLEQRLRTLIYNRLLPAFYEAREPAYDVAVEAGVTDLLKENVVIYDIEGA